MNRPPLVLFNYSFKNQGSGTCDVFIDGEIVDAPTQEILQNWFGDETSVSYKSFRNQIEAANPKTINVYVNSPGGHVGDSMAMHDYLKDLERKGVTVNRIGRGIIASAGTYLVMGNNSRLSENSMFMIHNIQMVAYGDINQVENQVKAGRKFNDLVTNFYVNETAKPKETISAWMNKETWFTATEAKENGFVKDLEGSASFSNSIKPEKWPFNNTAILNSYNSFTNNSKNSDMEIAKNITAAVKNALLESGIIKNSFKTDDAAVTKMANSIATAIEKEVSAGLDEKINKALTAAAAKNGGTGNVNVEEVVKNTLQAELVKTGEGSIAQAITDAVKIVVENQLKDNAVINKIQKDLKTLTDSVTDKLGDRANETDDDEADPKNKTKNTKKNFYQVGTFKKAEQN